MCSARWPVPPPRGTPPARRRCGLPDPIRRCRRSRTRCGSACGGDRWSRRSPLRGEIDLEQHGAREIVQRRRHRVGGSVDHSHAVVLLALRRRAVLLHTRRHALVADVGTEGVVDLTGTERPGVDGAGHEFPERRELGEPGPPGIRTLALIDHENKKVDLVGWATYNRDTLARLALVATHRTARLLRDKVGLEVAELLPGAQGGDAQIAARAATGGVDGVFFFV